MQVPCSNPRSRPIRWLQAVRDLSPKGVDDVAAAEAHLKRMTDLEKKAGGLAPRFVRADDIV